MVEAFVDTAPLYSFKPIDLEPMDRELDIDPDSSSDSTDIGHGILTPIDIFRENSMDGDSIIDEDMGGLPFVRRANPINELHSATIDDESDLDDETMETGDLPYFRVISPYPFSHTSKEEVEDREQLTCLLEWSLEKRPKCHVEYSSFFELGDDIRKTRLSGMGFGGRGDRDLDIADRYFGGDVCMAVSRQRAA